MASLLLTIQVVFLYQHFDNCKRANLYAWVQWVMGLQANYSSGELKKDGNCSSPVRNYPLVL